MSEESLREKALELHKRAPLIDLHADTLSSDKDTSQFISGWSCKHLDLPRMLETGIWGEAFSIFVHPKWANGDEKAWLELAEKELGNILSAVSESDKLALATKSAEVVANAGKGFVSAIIEVEGLHSFGGELDKIDDFFSRGVRIFTLTWNNSNPWATSCMAESGEGLTSAGREAIARINSLGGIVDFSHSGEKTFWDTIKILEKPPICTHSCCKSLKDSPRNLTDDQISALIDLGGVIGINFFPGFLSAKKYGQTTSADIVDHIQHIIDLGGEKNIGLGSDFDGVQCLPGMSDCTGITLVTEQLLHRGFPEETILGILGRNFLRIF